MSPFGAATSSSLHDIDQSSYGLRIWRSRDLGHKLGETHEPPRPVSAAPNGRFWPQAGLESQISSHSGQCRMMIQGRHRRLDIVRHYVNLSLREYNLSLREYNLSLRE